MKKREDLIHIANNGPLNGIVGVELGVAEGKYSERILQNCIIDHWYSIDMWAGDRGHDVKQYKSALSRLLPYKEINTVLRMKFDEALDLFPDQFFDVIYIDGYAHTGQESGKTLKDWWPKLKDGGLFSGDDYTSSWPATLAQVDQFSKEYNTEIKIFEFDNDEKDFWSQSPSWYTIKGT